VPKLELNPACFLAAHGVHTTHRGEVLPMTPCFGKLVRVHLIPRRMLPVALHADRRGWVLGCGGIVGTTGHHGMLDYSRTLRIPRAAIPNCTEDLAHELGLVWWLDREYGR
jgi:hypothetical protein